MMTFALVYAVVAVLVFVIVVRMLARARITTSEPIPARGRAFYGVQEIARRKRQLNRGFIQVSR